MRSSSFTLVIWFFITIQQIHCYTSYQLSNPATNDGFKNCGRSHQSWICDPSSFIDEKKADAIDELIDNAGDSNLVWCPSSSDIKDRDSYRGLQIGVAIVDSISNYESQRSRAKEEISKKSKRFATNLHDSWAIGEEGCNNAILIFITVYDRYLHISTGSGVKRFIKDDFLNNYLIPIHVRPLMKEKKYDDAIESIIEQIIEILANSDKLDDCQVWKSYLKHKEENKPGELFGLSYDTLFIVTLVLLGMSYIGFKYYKERDYRHCSSHLAALHAQSQAKKFDQKSCPICLEEFAGEGGETALLVCGHKFCKTCLDSWFNSQNATNQKCPICRHDRDDWSAATNNESDEHKTDDNEYKQNDEQQAGNDDDGNDDDTDDYQQQSYHKSASSDETLYTNENVRTNGRSRRRRNRNNYGGMNMNDWMFQQEMIFRMNRIRYMYPRYVSNDMVNRWSRPGYRGSFNQDQTFRRANPNYVPPSSSRSSGSSWSSGSSRSFGGGSSFGGGGGGGSW